MKAIKYPNHPNMFKQILRPFLHIAFLFKRPLTVGVRAICYETKTNSILLVKHIYSDGWVLPGGGVEVGESVYTALQRELKEEVGLICKDYQLIDIYHNNTISKRDHVVICSIDIWTEEVKHVRPKFEIMNSSWCKMDDLPSNLTPCTRHALKRYNYMLSK